MFRTLYCPDLAKKKGNKYALVKTDTARSEVITKISNSKSRMNPFKEALGEPDEKQDISAFQTEEYFDNLVALIEEAAKGCRFEKKTTRGCNFEGEDKSVRLK